MSKRDEYLARVGAMLASQAPPSELEAFLIANSNLPGRRGNLELAWAFGDAFETAEVDDTHKAQIWAWLHVSEHEAPTGDPREFLPFCALQALGSCFARADDETQRRILAALKAAASDGRWRVREGVAMGFQRIAAHDFEIVAATLDDWVQAASPIERRAIIAALAHPDLLTDETRVVRCLALVDCILRDVLTLDRAARRSEGFRVLKKGLQYAISVFVAAAPEEGFAFISRWAEVDDAGIRAILKANLKKARLAKRCPDQAARALKLLVTPGP